VNEKLLEIWIKARRKLDQVMLLALALLLGVMVLLYWLEQQAPSLVPAEQVKIEIPAETPANWTAFVNRFAPTGGDASKAPIYSALLPINVFEERSADSMTNLTKRIEDRYAQAKAAFDSNDTTKTETIIREILDLSGSHQKTLELRRALDARKGLVIPVVPTPAPPAM
jgi:hypothetical protein